MQHKRESPSLKDDGQRSLKSRLGVTGGFLRSTTIPWELITFPLILFICNRIALLGFSYIALTLTPDLLWYQGRPRPAFLQPYPALDGLVRWDSMWFEAIASRGYWEANKTNFFPLYPLLTRGLHEATGIHLRFALLIVPNVASLGAYLVIYWIFNQLAEEQAARWALVLFTVYPFAFFQAAAYPESLMIFFTALSILLALRGHHLWAGLALGLGVLTRHVALFAGAALLTAQILQRGFHPKRLLLSPALLGLLIPWLFLGFYCLYQYITFGNPLTFWVMRSDWGPRAWWGIMQLITTSERDVEVYVMYTYVPFSIILTVGAIALATNKNWIELATYAIVFMTVIWIAGIWGIGRYSASCWPAFLPLGVWLTKHPQFQGPVIALLALFQGLFFYLFAHHFPIL